MLSNHLYVKQVLTHSERSVFVVFLKLWLFYLFLLLKKHLSDVRGHSFRETNFKLMPDGTLINLDFPNENQSI